MNQLKPIYWDKLFSNLITDPPYFRSVQDVLHTGVGLSKNTKECQIAILSIDSMERKVMDKFNNHRDLLFFTLTNICNEFLQKGNHGFACRYWNNEHEILISARFIYPPSEKSCVLQCSAAMKQKLRLLSMNGFMR